MSNPLPDWPPTTSDQEQISLLSLAVDYALSNSLIVRPPGHPPSTTQALHAPFSLYPTPFPRHLFSQALELQPLYNEVYAKVANDDAFLESVIGGAVAKVDVFQGELWNIYKTIREEGVAQVSADSLGSL
jgi:glutathione synthase